jgi:2-phosphosulfolactate phosphatase
LAINGIPAVRLSSSPPRDNQPIVSSRTQEPAQVMTKVEVLFTPAEFQDLRNRDLSKTTCIVFDVLRATSTMITSLENGAIALIPVEEVEDAIQLKRERPDLLLAGERDGVRIRSKGPNPMTFDLGNSPREFGREDVEGRIIVITTTNGTRALLACSAAPAVFVGSFLNVSATCDRIIAHAPAGLLLVCGGTYNEAAYEDVLCAGAVIDALEQKRATQLADSALLAWKAYRLEKSDLANALKQSRNGRRLLEQPDLRDDVEFCAQRDRFAIVARLEKDGSVRTSI